MSTGFAVVSWPRFSERSDRPRRARVLRASLFVALLLSWTPSLWAQGASLSGVITDPQGAVIQNATIEIINVTKEGRSVATSGQDGRYTAGSLRAGTYTVLVTARGFTPHTSAIVLGSGRATCDVQMVIASLQSEVTVQATVVTIPTTPLSVGPVMDRPLEDLPYSVVVLPHDLIQNQQATSFRDMVKYMPSVQIEERGGSDVGRPQTRGFEGTVAGNTRIDGLNMVATTAHPMETFDRIEVLNGLSGTLNGPAQPAGTFNFVLKRPTGIPFQQITAKYDNQNSPTITADLGGPVGQSKSLGYRVNLLYGDGRGYVEQGNLKRWLTGASVDWRITPNTVSEFNFSYYHFDKKGFPGGFAYSPTVRLPEPLDPSTVGFGQKWGGSELYTRTGLVRVRHRLSQNWNVVVGVLDQWAHRGFTTPTMTLTNNNGDYKSTLSLAAAGRHEVDSDVGYLSGQFRTGAVSHDIAVGVNGFQWRTYGAVSTKTLTLGTGNIANPVQFSPPDLSVFGGTYHTGSTTQQSLIAGDTVTFSKSWSAILSTSQSWLRARNFNTSGATTSSYAKDGVSYGASLLYKPVQAITIYYTNADNLQQGDIAPATGVANPNAMLSPYRSVEHEIGLKAPVSSFNVTASVFRIQRPFAFADPADNVFKVEGDQVNYGAEVMATGQVAPGLTAYGGFTRLNPRLKNTGKISTSDKQVVGVPKTQANLLLEYRVPTLHRLSFNVNWHYTGEKAADDTNAMWASAYHTFDVGARFTVREQAVPAMLRFEVNNLTDKRYWASIFPGSINGASGSYSAFLGSGRTFMASLQVGL
jgi:iron complex outermembrane recepter protein